MSTQTISRDELLAERATMIGGSDAHHLLNLQPYGCARQLWYDKSGIEPDEPFEQTGAVRRGLRLEDVAVEYYVEQTGRQVLRRPHALRHAEYPFIAVHIDREIVPWPEDPGPGVLEVKTVGEQMYWRFRKDGLPERYICQLQWAMLVGGYKWGEFVVYWPDGDELLHFAQKPNKKIMDALWQAAVEFWPRIAKKDPPERLRDDSEQCSQCRWAERCQGAHMRELVERWEGRTAQHTPALAGLGEQYFQATSALKDAQKLVDEVKEEIRAAVGDALEATYPPMNGEAGLRVVYKPDLVWDEDRLAAEQPEIYARFSYPKLDGAKLAKAHPELESVYKTQVKLQRTLRIFVQEEQAK